MESVDVSSESALSGLAVICDFSGNINKIMHRNSDLFQLLRVGGTMAEIVDSTNHQKLQNFLHMMADDGVVLNWEINVIAGDNLVPMFFAGVPHGENEYLIVISNTSEHSMQLFDDMMRINNEQTNQLRELIKERTVYVTTQNTASRELYDELSRVNNELANLQREVMKKNAQLERLNNLKNQFLGMAAHDLRTPLDVILTYSDFLVTDIGDQLDEEHQEFLTIIRKHSQFMLNMVNDLLDIAVIESGQLVLNEKDVNIVQLIKNISVLNNAIARSKNIQIVFQTELEELIVTIDADRITQVVNNLLSNAIKFSNEGSQVIVTLSAHDQELEIEVQDFGIGMPEEKMADLFKQQLGHRSRKGTRGEKGSGLGLMIVDKIIRAHRGTIHVASTIDQGTTFKIKLPL